MLVLKYVARIYWHFYPTEPSSAIIISKTYNPSFRSKQSAKLHSAPSYKNASQLWSKSLSYLLTLHFFKLIISAITKSSSFIHCHRSIRVWLVHDVSALARTHLDSIDNVSELAYYISYIILYRQSVSLKNCLQ